MAAVARPGTLRRVAVVGSESTGKTTLARALARHYGTVWVPEFAREYLDTKGAPLECSDVEPIARGQIASEEKIAREASGVLILDTDLTSTSVFAEHYYGSCPDWIARAAVEREADLYLLTDIDMPWIEDTQRDRPHMREHMHSLFRASLERRGARYVNIAGTWEERFRSAREAIDTLMAEARRQS